MRLYRAYVRAIVCAGLIEEHADGRRTARYCGCRWCLVCARIRTARAVEAYAPTLSEMADPHFVTLTVRNVEAARLPATVSGLLDAVRLSGRWIKEKEGVPFVALRKLECTFNVRRRDYHPHLHLAVEGAAAARLLVDRWLATHRSTATADGQDVRPMDERGAVELLKYATKLTAPCTGGEGRRLMPIPALDTIFRALHGRRTLQPMGMRSADVAEEGEIGALTSLPDPCALGRRVLWLWDQQSADWIDHETGEVLTGYQPSERFSRFVEGR